MRRHSSPTPPASQTDSGAAKPPKATLRDVAAAAGVSVATASRALSKPGIVSPRIRALIAEKCEQLHYIPNHLARALTSDRSHAIGVIVPTVDNPVFMPMLAGMLEIVDDRDYALLINICHRDPDRELRQTISLVQRGVEAVLLGNPVHKEETSEILTRLNKPFVHVGGSPGGPGDRFVTFDGKAAMALAVRHVVMAGHRRIAVLTGPRATTPVIGDRIDGAVDCLRAHGLAPPAAWVIECGFELEDIRRGIARLLEGDERPTAVVCTGDQHAVMLMTACRQRGIRIPEEMSVTGCNDMFYIGFTAPKLTTVRTPYAEIGRRSAAMAMSLIDGEEVTGGVLLPPFLVEGETVAAPGPAGRRPAAGQAG